jgi:hypothetical protein
MMIWGLLMIVWLVTCLCVVALCVAAATGDAAQSSVPRRLRGRLRRPQPPCNVVPGRGRLFGRTRV